jgi:heme exporter protein D
MNLELFILNGYGQYVWPAFIFTFISFATLYRITKNELQKHEKMFLSEYKKFYTAKIKSAEANKNTKEVLSGSSI